MDRIIELSIYRLQILKWRDVMKIYGLTNEYFAASGFTPKVLPFKLNHMQLLAHPYPMIDMPDQLVS